MNIYHGCSNRTHLAIGTPRSDRGSQRRGFGACPAEPGVKASCGRHEARAVAVVGDPTRRVEVGPLSQRAPGDIPRRVIQTGSAASGGAH